MPQELRRPEFRTEEADYETERLLSAYMIINNPAIARNGFQQIAVRAFWPDEKQFDEMLFVTAMIKIDELINAG